MKKTMTIAALSLCAGLAAADSHTFDLSGLTSDGGFGANFQVTSLMHDFGFAGTVTEVEWDVTFTTNDPSWQSEAQIAIDTTDDTTLDADIQPGLFGAADEFGTFSYSGTLSANSASSDGLVYLTLWESFDDDVTPDAVYASGSFVTVTYVPAPAAGALLGLGGLVAARRRR